MARAPGGEALRFVLPPLPVTDDLPDERAVRTLSFGGGLPKKRGGAAPVSSVIEVSLRHGDLAYARHAVLVGHYLGDTIVSAELALDRRLHGALGRRRDLGLYPGARGSYAVFFNEEATASRWVRSSSASARSASSRRGCSRPACATRCSSTRCR